MLKRGHLVIRIKTPHAEKKNTTAKAKIRNIFFDKLYISARLVLKKDISSRKRETNLFSLKISSTTGYAFSSLSRVIFFSSIILIYSLFHFSVALSK